MSQLLSTNKQKQEVTIVRQIERLNGLYVRQANIKDLDALTTKVISTDVHRKALQGHITGDT